MGFYPNVVPPPVENTSLVNAVRSHSTQSSLLTDHFKLMFGKLFRIFGFMINLTKIDDFIGINDKDFS